MTLLWDRRWRSYEVLLKRVLSHSVIIYSRGVYKRLKIVKHITHKITSQLYTNYKSIIITYERNGPLDIKTLNL